MVEVLRGPPLPGNCSATALHRFFQAAHPAGADSAMPLTCESDSMGSATSVVHAARGGSRGGSLDGSAKSELGGQIINGVDVAPADRPATLSVLCGDP